MNRPATAVKRRLQEIRDDRVFGEVTYGKWRTAEIVVRPAEVGFRVVACTRGYGDITVKWTRTREEADAIALRITRGREGTPA